MSAAISKAMVEAAQSLLTDQVKGSFLGSEVQAKSEEELSLEGAWKALRRGHLATAIELTSTMLGNDRANEKLYFTRAYSYARAGEWQYAMADYSSYLKFQQATSGSTLANAYYGRALCLAKLGRKDHALRDLNECIRVGPVDEQMTEANASLVPKARAAKMALKQAFPELAGAEEQRANAAAAAKAAAEAAAGEQGAAGGASDEPLLEGKVWRVPITALEQALAKAAAAKKARGSTRATAERPPCCTISAPDPRVPYVREGRRSSLLCRRLPYMRDTRTGLGRTVRRVDDALRCPIDNGGWLVSPAQKLRSSNTRDDDRCPHR